MRHELRAAGLSGPCSNATVKQSLHQFYGEHWWCWLPLWVSPSSQSCSSTFLDGRLTCLLWQVYKGSAAMHFKVIKPNWEYRADGALALKDAGVALLEFAPAQTGTGSQPGERRYDWENKTVGLSCSGPSLSSSYHFTNYMACMQNIALSPVELGDLIETINGGQSGKAIYHDPNKGRTGYAISTGYFCLSSLTKPSHTAWCRHKFVACALMAVHVDSMCACCSVRV